MSDRVHSMFSGLAGAPALRARSDSVASLRPSASPLVDGAYRIDAIDQLAPFLVSVVSDCDLWMYLSSAGALTAGRGNEDRALFPYETDDKLHQHAGITGPMTMFRVHALDAAESTLWRPFHGRASAGVRRSLTKSMLGNRIVFEEHHDVLGLTFRAAWQACDAFGWVRSCELESAHGRAARIDVLDGVLNLLPPHAELGMQRGSSCLLNAYTQCELDVPSALAIYSLASCITDKAEPSEALFANVAFHTGLSDAKRLLSHDQLNAFIDGAEVTDEHLITGRRGAFLAVGRIELGRRGTANAKWRLAIDAHRSQAQVAGLQATLVTLDAASLDEQIDAALEAADRKLSRLVAAADAQQHTADTIVSAHHASNVLFNCMRGGAFAQNDTLPTADFANALAARNKAVAARSSEWLASLPSTIRYGDLLGEAATRRDEQLLRLTMEYLPLTFGRRHGDPSRPWNRFDIRVTNEDGSAALSYQGNWRDIFQNWEALAESYPVFLESFVAKFVNASTVDGFNPYRVTRDGIEWEVPDPHDPWAHIGYWGDHQIIYLLKLLEASRHAHAGAIDHLLAKRLFAYADVPYRLKSHAAMLQNRRDTIDFDWPRHRKIESSIAELGTDARLVRDARGDVLLVTLAEKLLVPALAKLSNWIPGVGIWMNTQRPEWNDANNALVGNGVSVVTLAYLRRYCAWCVDLFGKQGDRPFAVRADVVKWFDEVGTVLASTSTSVASDRVGRRAMFDQLGGAFEAYRAQAYVQPSETTTPLLGVRIVAFFEAALAHIDASLRQNQRRDGLFHAYNLLDIKGDVIDVGSLPVMLEGQVAILSSGLLSPSDAADVVERMFASTLWRADQQSFMLYPIQELPGFLQKNAVDEMAAMRSAFARRLLKSDDRSLLQRDVTGQIRFHPSLRNARDVEAALAKHAGAVDATARAEILELYEQTFAHHRFTGRSGSMYGYEGIGCIYWHMVAKLLLAVQENVWLAIDAQAPSEAVERLSNLYVRVRAGLGFNKSAQTYGAFPLDAYSHTPLHAGAQQPGMTGQVKEEILTRFGELGIRVREGIVHFVPTLLDAREFFAKPTDWHAIGPGGERISLPLPAASLAFTYAGTPIVYHLSDGEIDGASIAVSWSGADVARASGNALNVAASRALLSRDGSITRIEVTIPRHSIRSTASIDLNDTPVTHHANDEA